MICRHGMPSPASCIECMDDDGLGAEPVPPLTIEATFTARYTGHCTGGCNLPIGEGERVARMSDGTYRHAGCAS